MNFAQSKEQLFMADLENAGGDAQVISTSIEDPSTLLKPPIQS
jgi:hypothetical protein